MLLPHFLSNVSSSSLSSAPVIIARLSDPGATACETAGHCRTIWNIIWSCLGTIFVCIWVAIHPNIPQPRSPRVSSYRFVWTDLFSLLFGKLGIAFLALLAPEYIFAWALRQRLSASSLAKKCREAARDEKARERREREFSAAQARVAAEIRVVTDDAPNSTKVEEGTGNTDENTDAEEAAAAQLALEQNRKKFVACRRRALEDLAKSSLPTVEVENAWTTTHAFFILMGGFHVYDGDTPMCYLLPADVVELVRHGLIVPPSWAEIMDRGKSDSVAKAIVLFQTLWFVMQCIARHIEHLAITELEIATLAYTVLIAGIYLCWWNKPLGVSEPIRITKHVWCPEPMDESPRARSLWDRFHPYVAAFFGYATETENRARVPRYFAGNSTRGQIGTSDLTTLFMALSFGAVHCFAWSFHFPSDLERGLWRVSSILIITIPFFLVTLMVCVGLFAIPRLKGEGLQRLLVVIKFCLFLSILTYMAARLILLVVGFTSLRFLNPSAYETVYWTTFIPHI